MNNLIVLFSYLNETTHTTYFVQNRVLEKYSHRLYVIQEQRVQREKIKKNPNTSSKNMGLKIIIYKLRKNTWRFFSKGTYSYRKKSRPFNNMGFLFSYFFEM